MDTGFPSDDDALPVSALERIDKVCLRFEGAWKSGRRPQVEQYLGDVAEPERSALLRELLLLELDYRQRSGETPSRGKYETRYSDHIAVVADVFARFDETIEPGRTVPCPGARTGKGAGAATLAVGQRVGRYTIQRHLGSGGFGAVYLAWDEELQRAVAVKIPHRERFKSVEEESRFFEEARTIAHLKHPAIVPVFDVGRQEDGTPYVVMEYVEGDSLEEVLESGGLKYSALARLLVQVADALHHAHRSGFVHRDLKPANILMDTQGNPHITDFGLAERWHQLDERSPHARSAIAGTLHFIPPEVCQGRGQIDPRSDVYALGVMIYRALTGHYPYRGATLAEVMEAAARGEAALPKDVNPEVPEPLQRICLKALEGDPAARYSSARALAADLRRFLEGREVLARPQRYNLELRGKLQNHCVEIQSWQEQNLISYSEMDRLLWPYWFAVEAQPLWQSLSQRFPWETVAIRLGGWFVLLGSLLWPAYYWPDLSGLGRVLSVGFPTLVLNGVGWLFRGMGRRWNARVFLGIGAALLPLFVAVLLTECNWPTYNQGREAELFPSSIRSDGSGKPFAATNIQMTIAAAAFVVYCAVLLRSTSALVFVVWAGLGLYGLFAGVLLVLGLKHWILHGHVARSLLCCLVPCFAVGASSIVCRLRGRRRAAAVLCTLFPVPTALVMTGLGWFGSTEWLGAEPELDSQTINLWWMANGLIYGVLAVLGMRSRVGFIRYWGGFFLLLVPVSLLVPTNLLFRQGTIAGLTIGGEAVSVYEIASGILAVGFIVLGTITTRWPLSVPGLVGLATFVLRVTDLHFQANLRWPLVMALGGGAAILAGVASLFARARREQQAML